MFAWRYGLVTICKHIVSLNAAIGRIVLNKYAKLLCAEIYEENEHVYGFIGCIDTYIAGLFVMSCRRGKGTDDELAKGIIQFISILHTQKVQVLYVPALFEF